MEKAKKPRSEAQKAADKRYRDKHRHEYGQISVNLPIAEISESRDLMERLGIGPAEIWRRAIAELKKDSQ